MTEQNNTPEPSTGATEEQAKDLVRVEEATDEELTSHLAKLQDPDREETEESDEDTETEPTEESQPEEEPVAAEPQGDPIPEKKVYTEEEVQKLQADLARERDRHEQQERFLQRRNTELGQLREQLATQTAQLQQLLQGDDLSPAQAAQAVMQVRDNEQQMESLQQEQERTNYYHTWHKVVSARVNPKEVTMNDLVDVLKDQQVPDEVIENFRRNPADSVDPAAMINLAEAAKWRKKTRDLAIFTKQVLEENKKLKAKPTQDLKNIEAAARSSVGVNGNSGAQSASRKPSSNPGAWSDAELDAALNQLR